MSLIIRTRAIFTRLIQTQLVPFGEMQEKKIGDRSRHKEGKKEGEEREREPRRRRESMKRGQRGHAERNEKEGKRRLDFKYQKLFGMNPRRSSYRKIETSPVERENTEKTAVGGHVEDVCEAASSVNHVRAHSGLRSPASSRGEAHGSGPSPSPQRRARSNNGHDDRRRGGRSGPRG